MRDGRGIGAGMRARLAGAAAMAALTLGAAGARAETLTDALISAYRTSGLLEQNRALLRAADEDVAQAVTALYPVLNWQIDSGYVEPANDTLTASIGLTGQLTLWDGGANRLAIDAAKESVLALREGLVVAEQQVLFDAVSAYMDVLNGVGIVSLRESNVRLIGRELRAARDRFEVGEITRTDVSLAEARLALARSQLAVAEGDLAIAREEYLRAVGRYPGDLRQPQDAPLPATTVEEAKARAVRGHPAVRRAQRQVTVNEISAARADASRNPRLQLGAGLSASVDDLPRGVNDRGRRTVTLSLGGPVYQAGRIDSLVRQAVAQTEAARAGLLLTTEQIAQQAGNAFAQLLVARAVLDSSQRQVVAQQQAFEGTREEATLGARTTLDVLDAEQDLLDARTTVVTALMQRYVAQYALLSAQGLLTVDYLRLGIPTYDPAAYYNAVKDAPVYVSPQGQALDRVIKSLNLDR